MPAVEIHSITKTPRICGGAACIHGHRIPIWILVNYRRQGASETDILQAYPQLTKANLRAAWTYYQSRFEEIDAAIKKNELSEEDTAAAQKVSAFELPDDRLADLAKTRKPPQWWYEKDENLF
ncbi:MAG TPA: DUF433 domain-containing protein [Gemmataceae bacterium]|nr:DUF433 domain-containing protein [Gemmataceae bacterium]